MNALYVTVIIIWMIAILIFYHKIFSVYYFSLGQGIIKELLFSFFLGAIMTYVTFYFWWVTAIVILFAGLSAKAKVSNNAPLIIAVVLIIVVAIIGISTRANTKDSKTSASVESAVTQEYISC